MRRGEGMEKFPVFWKKQAVGELTVEREPLYSWYTVRTCLPEEGLWSAWLIGSGGDFRLGVLESDDCGAILRRRFSDRMLMPYGNLLRVELRAVAKIQNAWEQVLDPEKYFRTAFLRTSLCEYQNLLVKQAEKSFKVAILYDKEKRFPLLELFCFAEFFIINGKEYLVYSFDPEEQILAKGHGHDVRSEKWENF